MGSSRASFNEPMKESTSALFLLSLGCFSSLSPVLGQSYEWEEDEGVAMRRLIQNRMPNTCTTSEGERCIFPFVYNGVTHYKCTYSGSPTPWCATAVDRNNNNGVITNNWGDCAVSTTSACQAESIEVPTCTTTSGPSSGQSCVFPFRHRGIVFHFHIDGEYGFCPSTCPGG